jgi:hypothetical protein
MKIIKREFGSTGTKLALSRGDYAFGSTGTKLALSRRDYVTPYDIGVGQKGAVVKGKTVDGAVTTADNKDIIECAIEPTGKTIGEGDDDQVKSGSEVKGDTVWEALGLRWLMGAVVERVKGMWR